MKVSIDKELTKISNEDKLKYNVDPINEVKLLLAGDSSEDARILRGLSNNSQFNRIENVRGKQIMLENLEKEYEGNVFTRDQIKRLCVDYRLRFLQSQYFTGAYDIQVAAKIKEFAKTTNTPIEEYNLGRRFFVMAPAKMFSLQDEKYVSKADLRRQADPAIFYQIDEQHFRLVHKWGNDFSITRLIEGFRWKSWWNHQIFNTVMIMPIVAALYFFCFSEPAALFENHIISSTIFVSIISFGLAYLTMGIWKQDEFTAIKGYFSETNWDSQSKITR